MQELKEEMKEVSIPNQQSLGVITVIISQSVSMVKHYLEKIEGVPSQGNFEQENQPN